MVTRRSAKNKGNQFEYEVAHNLEHYGNKVYLTKELGFQKQYDICVEWRGLRVDISRRDYIECKFHKSISWNEAKKYFLKLETVAKKQCYDDTHYLIFKSNQQPVLMMYRDNDNKETITVKEFTDYFGRGWRKRNEKISKKTS